MVSGFLLDTDIAIELLRGRDPRVAGRLSSKEREQVFLSTITISEYCLERFAAAVPTGISRSAANVVLRFTSCGSITVRPNVPARCERILRRGENESGRMIC
jgi:predicted nucleic acid-binding protein